MLWESCSKLNFKQLSHSMSVAYIASLAVAMETCDPWMLAKLAIFATDMLWESCSKSNLKQLSHSMSVANIASFKKNLCKIFFQKYIFVWNFFTNKMIYVITDEDFFLPTQGLGVP